MKKSIVSLLASAAAVLLLCSCVSPSRPSAEGYESITPAEAKELMDSRTGYIILDVRTEDEYASGHIPGAILIPDYDIAAMAQAELPDKDRLILVYCRSGRRSKLAAEQLAAMGYTCIREFGGIIDWPYEIETE